MKHIIIIASIALSCVPAFAIVDSSFAGTMSADSLYTVDGYLGGGYVYNLSSFPYGVDGLSRNGYNAYARVMWSPNHMLDVGVEFGFTTLYKINPAQKTAVDYTALNAYPIYLVMSMEPINRISISAGFGTAILASVVNDYQTQTAVTTASTSVFLAARYMWPLADKVRLGLEARASTFDRFKDINASFNVVLAYSLIRY
ncbi:MAG: hypothetical protein NTX15_03800 [Candidatus Kapabacteria bacterium]|nr:hypothetical protein [Candidatus Kapabacteria bacterium]